MKIVIAMDSFKGCLSSREAGNAAAEGVRQVLPEAEVVVRPLADGGEGTVAALAEGATGRVTVTGPLGESVECEYGIVRKSGARGCAQDGTASDDLLAVIECSGACGLPLVTAEQRNPMYTTTYGLGEVILDAAAKGCRRFLIGLGGSATNDGGAGMLQALGYRLTDAEGNDIGHGAAGLMRLAKIEQPAAEQAFRMGMETHSAKQASRTGMETPSAEQASQTGIEALSASNPGESARIIRECTFRVACDVTNPLCGPLGCSAVFGPQKGARTEDIPVMDEALRRYAEKVREYCKQHGPAPAEPTAPNAANPATAESTAPNAANPAPAEPTSVNNADPDTPGSGAAGGLGFAFRAMLGAELLLGSQLVIQENGLEQYIEDADLVITGEGRLDAQTAMGKAPAAVAALAQAHGIPVIALAGSVEAEESILRKMGLTAWYGINDRTDEDLATAMRPEVAQRNMAETAARAARDFTPRQ